MRDDSISSPSKIKLLSLYFYNLTTDIKFKNIASMGALLTNLFNYVSVNNHKYETTI